MKTKTMIIDGVEYIEAPAKKDFSCDGCAFESHNEDDCFDEINTLSIAAFGSPCEEKGIIYKVVP